MSVSLKASNGVGYNYTYTVTAADASAGYVQFDFNSSLTVSAIPIVLSSNAVVDLTGALITYPSVGVMKIASGGGYTVTAGQVIVVVGGIIGSLVS